jgi:glycosyltransferase involved in cell wall biosynthesis
MLLTIAIPSFNRPESALQAIKNLLESSKLPEQVQVILANNGSTEEGYDLVEQFVEQIPNATYLSFSDNLGFAGNLLRLIQNCESKYVLTMSDEDDLDTADLQKLLQNLKSKSPNLCILRSFTSKPNKTKKLRAKSLKGASSSMSGIILNLDSLRPMWPKITNLVSTEEFGTLYPQVILALILFSQGNSNLCSTPTISARSQLPTTIRSSNGNVYWHPTERVYQYLSLNRSIKRIGEEFVPISNRRLVSFRKANERKFFGSILDAISMIEPEIVVDFTRSSFITAINAEFRTLFRNFRRFLARLLGKSN